MSRILQNVNDVCFNNRACLLNKVELFAVKITFRVWFINKIPKITRRCLTSTQLLCFDFAQQPCYFRWLLNLSQYGLSYVLQIRPFALNLSALYLDTSKTPCSFQLNICFKTAPPWCPEQDSNLHTREGASPSSWCVYQFHHLGNYLTTKVKINF